MTHDCTQKSLATADLASLTANGLIICTTKHRTANNMKITNKSLLLAVMALLLPRACLCRRQDAYYLFRGKAAKAGAAVVANGKSFKLPDLPGKSKSLKLPRIFSDFDDDFSMSIAMSLAPKSSKSTPSSSSKSKSSKAVPFQPKSAKCLDRDVGQSLSMSSSFSSSHSYSLSSSMSYNVPNTSVVLMAAPVSLSTKSGKTKSGKAVPVALENHSSIRGDRQSKTNYRKSKQGKRLRCED